MSVLNRKQQRIARALAAGQGIPYQQAIRLVLATAPQSTVALPELPIVGKPYSPNGLIPFGRIASSSNEEHCVGLKNADLASHLLVCGADGTGKSEMLKWLAFGVAKAGAPLVIFDSRGELAESLLRGLIANVPERVGDIVFCDLADPQWTVACNPLDVAGAEEIPAVVAGIVGALRLPREKLRGELAGHALTALCKANLYLGDEANKCTLLDLPAFFTDIEFRRLVMEVYSGTETADIEPREMFDPETGPFELLSDRQQEERTREIIRRLIPLQPPVAQARSLSVPDKRLDFEVLASKGALVIVKLASSWRERGHGELAGSLVFAQLLQELGRGHLGGLRVLVDDAPGIIGNGIGTLLKQAQRENVGFIISCQYPGQFDRKTLPGVLANTGSKVLLRLDAAQSEDAVARVDGGTGTVGEREVAGLPNFGFWANALVSGERSQKPSGPVRATCLEPLQDRLEEEGEKLRELVLARSRDILGYPAAEVLDRKRARDHVKGDLGQILIARADAVDHIGWEDWSEEERDARADQAALADDNALIQDAYADLEAFAAESDDILAARAEAEEEGLLNHW